MLNPKLSQSRAFLVQDRARAISVLSFGRKPEPELLGSCWWEVCALWFHLFGGASQLEPEVGVVKLGF